LIICPTLSIFRFVIRGKNKCFYEVPRLLAHPLGMGGKFSKTAITIERRAMSRNPFRLR
jgi:hypothetical protein